MDKLPRIAPIQCFEGDTLEVQHYLEEDYDDMSLAAQEIPSIMETINELRRWHTGERDSWEDELKRREARAYFELRGSNPETNFEGNYPGKPTEEAMKHAVCLEKTVIEAKEKIAFHSAEVGRLTGTLFSLQAKIDLSRSSESTRRSVFKETTPSR